MGAVNNGGPGQSEITEGDILTQSGQAAQIEMSAVSVGGVLQRQRRGTHLSVFP